MKRGIFTSAIGLGILLVVGGLTGCGEETQIAAAAAVANGPPARPLQTGQTACYDASGKRDNTIPCAGSGQDAVTQTGVAHRYIDNRDGTISDASTGLMWERKDQGGGINDEGNVYTWSDAVTLFITGLNNARFAGHSDWRVPNLNELLSIVDYGTWAPAIDAVFNTNCTPSCMVTPCSCTKGEFYWSSTTYQPRPSDVWGVTFGDGGMNTLWKSDTFHIRAVRGGL